MFTLTVSAVMLVGSKIAQSQEFEFLYNGFNKLDDCYGFCAIINHQNQEIIMIRHSSNLTINEVFNISIPTSNNTTWQRPAISIPFTPQFMAGKRIAYYAQTYTYYNNRVYATPILINGSDYFCQHLYIFDMHRKTYINDTEYNHLLPQSTTDGDNRPPCIVSADDNIYVIGGGIATQKWLKGVQIYNISNDSWSFGSKMRTGRHQSDCVATSDEELIYVLGGAGDPGDIALKNIEKYIIDNNQWESVDAELEIGRKGHQCILFGYIFCTGGAGKNNNGTYLLNSTEIFDVHTEEIVNTAYIGNYNGPKKPYPKIITIQSSQNYILFVGFNGNLQRAIIPDTRNPTASPTMEPTINPTTNPTVDTMEPTIDPTIDPTRDPSIDPTVNPTISPTQSPSSSPTKTPTIQPTLAPTSAPSTSFGYLLREERKYLQSIFDYIMLFIVLVFIIIGATGSIDARYLRINDFYRLGKIIAALIQILDMVSDCFLSIDIGINSKYNNNYSLALYIFIIFIILPSMFSLIQVYFQSKHWSQDAQIKEWLIEYSKLLYSLTIITGSSFSAIDILNSNFLGLRYFEMGLSKKQLISFKTKRLYSIVMLENIPQLALQIWYILSEKDNGTTNIIAMSSVVFSAVSIIVTILSMTMQKTLIDSQQCTLITMDVIGKSVVRKSKQCRRRVKKIREGITNIIGLDSTFIEMLKTKVIANGLELNILFYVHMDECKNRNYDVLLEENQSNGELSQLIYEAWHINDVPRVSNIQWNGIQSALSMAKLTSVSVDTNDNTK